MQVPILSGIFTDNSSDVRVSYPRNLVPVFANSGLSAGYLRPADGIVQLGTGPGNGRGGVEWNDVCYRAMGTKLVRIDAQGNVTTIGDIGGSDVVTFDYSFDHLAIASDGDLWLYDGTDLQQVTDVDVRNVVDLVWVDGYFMITDGEYLIVTELNNPFAINPLKYGSSEADPDPVKALLKHRNEVYALNRHTIELFTNIGGEFFPFERIEGAQIQKGVVGTHACCLFGNGIAFLGGGKNEALAIYVGANGNTGKISSSEVDRMLGGYTLRQIEGAVLESKTDLDTQQLYVHLPDQTLVYDSKLSAANGGDPVWFVLSSSLFNLLRYRGRDLVRCYGKWLVSDPDSAAFGYLSPAISTHYGSMIGWEFATSIFYNEGRGAIFHELELCALTGRTPLGNDPVVWTQYSLDGLSWSMEKSVKAGKIGDRLKRLVWMSQGNMRNWRVQRFRGTSDSHLSFTRLEARLEPLSV